MTLLFSSHPRTIHRGWLFHWPVCPWKASAAGQSTAAEQLRCGAPGGAHSRRIRSRIGIGSSRIIRIFVWGGSSRRRRRLCQQRRSCSRSRGHLRLRGVAGIIHHLPLVLLIFFKKRFKSPLNKKKQKKICVILCVKRKLL